MTRKFAFLALIMPLLLPAAASAQPAPTTVLAAPAGDALSIEAKGGLVERAERFVILGLGLLFDQFLVAALAMLVVLNLATAVQRFAKVWTVASKPQPIVRQVATNRRRARSTTKSPAAERWQARRAEMRERSRSRRGDF